MKCISFDLQAVVPIALENMSKMGIADKVEIRAGDFFNDPFPTADVITMGNILHDWNTEAKETTDKQSIQSPSQGRIPGCH